MTIEDAKRRVKRARQKLSILKRRQQQNTPGYDYWQANLDEAEADVYRLTVAAIVAKHGPVRIGLMYKQDYSSVIRVDDVSGNYIQELSKDIVPKTIYSRLNVLYDNRPNAHECEFLGCTRRDTQYHHFAPRHLFDDADSWPGAYLCAYHHTLWHEIVTPNSTNGGRRESTATVSNALSQ